MKLAEYIIASLAIIGIILRFFDIQGAIALSTIFVLLLANFHYLFGFAVLNDVKFKKIFKKEYYKENNIDVGEIISAIFFAWSLSILEIAILFKVLDWSGSKMMFITGFTGTVIFGTIFIVLNIKKKAIVKSNLIRIAIIFIFSVLAISLF